MNFDIKEEIYILKKNHSKTISQENFKSKMLFKFMAQQHQPMNKNFKIYVWYQTSECVSGCY